MATIKLQRTNDFINALRDYRLFIDGKKVGTIGNGQTIDLEISNGPHTLIAKIDWCSSPEISFEINENDTKIFLVGALKNGKLIIPLISVLVVLSIILPNTLHSYYKLLLVLPSFLLLFYYLTFGRKNFLTLTEL
jgi:hypothetical protein